MGVYLSPGHRDFYFILFILFFFLIFKSSSKDVFIFLSFEDFIYLFLQRGEGRGKEDRNINVWLPLVRPLLETWPETQACALTGNGTSDLLLPSLVLSPVSHTSQGLKMCLLISGR